MLDLHVTFPGRGPLAAHRVQGRRDDLLPCGDQAVFRDGGFQQVFHRRGVESYGGPGEPPALGADLAERERVGAAGRRRRFGDGCGSGAAPPAELAPTAARAASEGGTPGRSAGTSVPGGRCPARSSGGACRPRGWRGRWRTGVPRTAGWWVTPRGAGPRRRCSTPPRAVPGVLVGRVGRHGVHPFTIRRGHGGRPSFDSAPFPEASERVRELHQRVRVVEARPFGGGQPPGFVDPGAGRSASSGTQRCT